MKSYNRIAYERALGRLNSTHPQMLPVCVAAIRADIPLDEVLSDARGVWDEHRDFDESEWGRTYQNAGGLIIESRNRPAKERVVLPQTLTTPHDTLRLIRAGWGATEDNLRARSPIPVPADPVAQYELLLESLFAPDDQIFVGNKYQNQTETAAHFREDARAWLAVRHPYICFNTYTGERLENGFTKEGHQKYTQRKMSLVKDFRMLLIEFDEMPDEIRPDGFEDKDMPKEWQYAFWSEMIGRLPVVALIDSGNKSIHGWVAVRGVTNLEQWTAVVKNGIFARYLQGLGVDKCVKDAGRLSRTVGHLRDGVRPQSLIYLNPEPLGGDRSAEWDAGGVLSHD